MFLQANPSDLGMQECRSDPGYALTNGISLNLIACLHFQLPDRVCEHRILCTQQCVGQDLSDPWERCSRKAADERTYSHIGLAISPSSFQ